MLPCNVVHVGCHQMSRINYRRGRKLYVMYVEITHDDSCRCKCHSVLIKYVFSTIIWSMHACFLYYSSQPLYLKDHVDTGVDRWGTGGTRPPPPLFRVGGQHRNCPPHFSVQKNCEASCLTQHFSVLKAAT